RGREPAAGEEQQRATTTHGSCKGSHISSSTAVISNTRSTPRFRGFDRSAMQFWHELAAEMSREWFAANRPGSERLWRLPMIALIEDVARRLAPVYRPLKLDPPGLLRIH